MESKLIIEKLPYSYPFLFVDEIEEIREDGVRGNYRFPEGSFFYQGHFKKRPVTPGVILAECLGQIGLVSLGIFLVNGAIEEQNTQIAMSNMDIDFFLPVFPGEKVWVTSEKEYFRFQKLKCKVQMRNESGKLVCKGEISGMITENE